MRLFCLAAIDVAQSRPLAKAAMFSAGLDGYARIALLRAFEKSPVFLQQLTGLYCETGKNSGEMATECHIKGQQTLPNAPCAGFKGNATPRLA